MLNKTCQFKLFCLPVLDRLLKLSRISLWFFQCQLWYFECSWPPSSQRDGGSVPLWGRLWVLMSSNYFQRYRSFPVVREMKDSQDTYRPSFLCSSCTYIFCAHPHHQNSLPLGMPHPSTRLSLLLFTHLRQGPRLCKNVTSQCHWSHVPNGS